MAVQLAEQEEDWAKMIYFLSSATGATITDVNRMDVSEFFSFYRVAVKNSGR
jgi:hypothetical protein